MISTEATECGKLTARCGCISMQI
uniref:Uncharacterized protein n=1 Tax=Arundo donax TaxID=35708 RepID=A0A0A9EHA3_ARUDO